MAGFYEKALAAIQQAVDEQFGGNVSAASAAWGLKNDNLHKWLRRERTPQLDLISPVLDQLCVYTFDKSEAGTIRRIGPNAPDEKIAGEDLLPIPIKGEVGAGNEIEIEDNITRYYLRVPERYYSRGLYGFEVAGNSMEPTINKGAIVGVKPYDGNLIEGNIYLIRRKNFGLMIKRVRMGKGGSIEIYSDNPAYEPDTIQPDEYDSFIAAQIVWVWQEC